MVRKEALSNWLREVVDDKVQEEVAELDSEERQILSLLSGKFFSVIKMTVRKEIRNLIYF